VNPGIRLSPKISRQHSNQSSALHPALILKANEAYQKRRDIKETEGIIPTG